MTPALRPGDRVLVDYRRRPVVGDVVVALFPGAPDDVLVVKRVGEDRGGSWYLVSDNPEAPGAVDSRGRGPVRDEKVLGVVRGRWWPCPGRVRRAV